MTIQMCWPILLAVAANVVYHICAKSTPAQMDPLASLTVTYVVGTVMSALCYVLLHRGGNLLQEYSRLNWAPLLLGVAVVGLEIAAIYMYKVGWAVNTGYLVQSIFIAIALSLVGTLLYHETLTWTKAVGMVLCLIGIVFMNK